MGFAGVDPHHRSIFTSLFTATIYLSAFTFTSTFFYLLRSSFVNDKAGGIDNSSVLVGSKVICSVQVQVKEATFVLKMVPLFLCHLVYLFESYWRQTLVSLLRKITATLHLNLPLGVTNEGREAIKLIPEIA